MTGACPGRPQAFFQAPDHARVDDALAEQLESELARLSSAGVEEAIWSNEAFLPRSGRIIPVLRRVANRGWPVRLVCYVRRHDEWAKSGYVQFALKAKPYTGRVKSFDEWIAGQDIGFAPALNRWEQAFPGCLTVFNYDVIDDVTAHFLGYLGIEGLAPVTANRQPPPEILAAWSVFNGRREAGAMPGDFLAVARGLGVLDEGRELGLPLEALLPGRDALEALQQRYGDDLDAVNRHLERSGEAPLEFGPVQQARSGADPWALSHLLFEMVFALEAKVSALSAEVEALRKQATGGN